MPDPHAHELITHQDDLRSFLVTMGDSCLAVSLSSKDQEAERTSLSFQTQLWDSLSDSVAQGKLLLFSRLQFLQM